MASNPPDIYGFMHVATIGRWRQIVDEQFALLQSSGLYDRTTKLFVGIVGPEAYSYMPPGDKVEVVFRSDNLQEYEFPTLSVLHRFCLHCQCLVYYIHAKGVFRDSINTDDWRRYLQYFSIERYESCIDVLKTYQICGVNWSHAPWPHFSGNFWWATSSHIATLLPAEQLVYQRSDEESYRHQCERWIGSNPGARVACFHQSNVNHYHHRYPRSLYAGAARGRCIEVSDTGVTAFPGEQNWNGGKLAVSYPEHSLRNKRVALIFDNVARPDTTGFYCLRALRQLLNVSHFLPSQIAEIPEDQFDLYLYIDDGMGYELPSSLRPSAMWAIDTHIEPNRLITRAKDVDYAFAAQRNGVTLLQSNGLNCLGWLPLACDPSIHWARSESKDLDVSFIASFSTPARRELAAILNHRYPRSFVGQRFFGEMAELYARSKIVINLSISNDLNMRVFEALSCGSLLITNEIGDNGMMELFQPDEHLVIYRSIPELLSKIDHFISDDQRREAIAAAGKERALSYHTYVHRMSFLLQNVPLRLKPSSHQAGDIHTLASSDSSKITIVVVTCNQFEYTRQCIESVGVNTNVPYELVVVDNGSTDQTKDYLRSFPEIKLIENPENRGFTRAVNQGIRASAGSHVVLLNNDTIVAENWLGNMLKALNTDSSIGLVGPSSNNVPGPQRIRCTYQEPTSLDEVAEGLVRTYSGRYEEAYVLVGFCLLIRRRVIDTIGLFDEAFGIGTYEDYDYCRRAVSAGFRLAIARDAFVHHFGSKTFAGNGVDVLSLLRTNRIIFEQRWGSSHSLAPKTVRTDRPDLTSIVIATFNGLEFTQACIESIRRCTTEAFELIVVDNGSTDGTIDYLSLLPWITLIANGQNFGFPAAMNQGLMASKGDKIVLLNNDVVVTPRWLTQLTRALDRSPSIGLVGPCSNEVSGAQRIGVSYRQLDQLDGFSDQWSVAHDQEVQEVSRLVGFCLMFRHEMIERIGLLDREFGIGNFEDDDYCLRARSAGLRCIIARDCFVHHFGSATFRANPMNYATLLQNNEQMFRAKWWLPPSPVQAQRTPEVPVTQPRLSLCMIVRDSAQTLRACIESVRPWVDELVIVDTGSVDETPQIVQECGAIFDRFAWCDDFSAARNHSLDLATGEWIFWMDSDDTIDAENGKKLRDLVNSDQPPSVLGFVLQVHCPAGTNAKSPYATATVVDHVKLFRNRPDIRFTGRIHEQVLPAIRQLNGEVKWTDIYVTHSGSDGTPEGRSRKQQRDLRILERDLAENPDSTFSLFNMGMTLLDMERPTEALNYLSRSLQLATSGESHLRKLYALLTQAYFSLNRPDTALRTCIQGLAVCPGDPELIFRRGVLEQALGLWDQAIASFRTIIQETPDRHFSSTDRGIFGIKVWHNLAIIYQQQKRYELSADAWRHVLDFDQSNVIAWHGLLDSYSDASDLAGLEQLSSENGRVPSEIAAIARARIAVYGGANGNAIALLEESTQGCVSDELLEELCKISFFANSLDHAQKWLEVLVQRRPHDAIPRQNLGIVHFRKREFRKAAENASAALRIQPDYTAAQKLLHEATQLNGSA